jgi:hypothetical protein
MAVGTPLELLGPAAGLVVPNWARTDLCGGRLATTVPTANDGHRASPHPESTAASVVPDAGDATGVRFAVLKEDTGDIVAITNAVLVGVAGRHAIAAVIEDAAHQDGGRAIEAHLSCLGVLCKQALDSIEGGTIDDEGMLAGGLAPVALGWDAVHAASMPSTARVTKSRCTFRSPSCANAGRFWQC